MTTRDLASVAIKILGIHIAIGAIVTLFGLAIAILFPDAMRSIEPETILQICLSGVVPRLLAGGACIGFGSAIAGQIVPRDAPVSLGINRVDLLSIGIALAGLWIAASELINILGFVGGATYVSWNSKGWRYADLFRDRSTITVDGIVQSVLGIVLALSSRNLANWFESRLPAAGPVA
jgi:hypothetical protein